MLVLDINDLKKYFKDRLILDIKDFKMYLQDKIGIVGLNGSGKTTLLKMILARERGINISQRAKIGYFSQDLSILDDNKSIIDNVMEESIYDETTVRIMLARLLFKREDVYKKVKVLSGGERVKVSLAKILVSDFNILILDEPTNYLDISSIEAIEEALSDYEGTILFVSHDRRFIDKIADNIIYIGNQEIKTFNGTLEELESRKNRRYDIDLKELIEKKAVLEYRIAEIIGKLSMPSRDDDIEALDREYKKAIKKLKDIKEGSI